MSYTYESTYLDYPVVPGRAWDLFHPGPEANETQPVALFFVHGGGWHGGSREHFHPIMGRLIERGYYCGSTDYRLNGVDLRDQVADVRAAYIDFHKRLAAIGGPGKVVVFGSSAGAHLALMLALSEPGACGEAVPAGFDVAEWARCRPTGVAAQASPTTFEPWDDMFPGIRQSMQRIIGASYDERPDLYRAMSPIRHVKPGGPAVFLMEAENEHMFPADINATFLEAVRAAGGRAETKTYRRAEHGFFYDVTRRCQIEAFDDLIAFVESLREADCSVAGGSTT